MDDEEEEVCQCGPTESSAAAAPSPSPPAEACCSCVKCTCAVCNCRVKRNVALASHSLVLSVRGKKQGQAFLADMSPILSSRMRALKSLALVGSLEGASLVRDLLETKEMRKY